MTVSLTRPDKQYETIQIGKVTRTVYRADDGKWLCTVRRGDTLDVHEIGVKKDFLTLEQAIERADEVCPRDGSAPVDTSLSAQVAEAAANALKRKLPPEVRAVQEELERRLKAAGEVA